MVRYFPRELRIASAAEKNMRHGMGFWDYNIRPTMTIIQYKLLLVKNTATI